MPSDSELAAVVRSWLRSEPDEPADALVADVLAVLPDTPQHAAVRIDRQPVARLSIASMAIAAVLVIALLSVVMLWATRPTDVGVPGPSPSPAPATYSPGPSPSPREKPDGPTPDATGALHIRFDEVGFTVTMPAGWGSFGPDYPHYISRSAIGPQGAEAQVFWTQVPPGTQGADYCYYLLNRETQADVADLVEAVTEVPGTNILSGPTQVTVDGRSATHVVLLLRADVGCDPGFFFSYPNLDGGALWPETKPGDIVRVWIVDVDPGIVFIEGKTHPVLQGSRIEQALEADIQEIVDSIVFD